MRKYEEITIKSESLVVWECSVCGADLLDNEMESQEAVSISIVGGYSSVFGDGNKVTLDICQHCFKRKLGKYCTID